MTPTLLDRLKALAPIAADHGWLLGLLAFVALCVLLLAGLVVGLLVRTLVRRAVRWRQLRPERARIQRAMGDVLRDEAAAPARRRIPTEVALAIKESAEAASLRTAERFREPPPNEFDPADTELSDHLTRISGQLDEITRLTQMALAQLAAAVVEWRARKWGEVRAAIPPSEMPAPPSQAAETSTIEPPQPDADGD